MILRATPLRYALVALAALHLLIILRNDRQREHGVIVMAFQMTMLTSPTTPLLGIGAVLFRPQGLKVEPASAGTDDVIVQTGKFFTDAFWTAKVGGGTKKLTKNQKTQLTNQQIAEFRRRYGPIRFKKDLSELLVCTNAKGDIMGCLGVEVDTIKKSDGREKRPNCALMSNVAVGRQFRRRGVAEELVRQAELMVRKSWGYPDIYLYVEKQNTPAVKLYRKMGYKTVWEDSNAQTLLPTENGSIDNKSTTILCMKKSLIRRGLLSNPFR